MAVDPRKPETLPKPHRWATYVPCRSAKFKTHSRLALAKNAISGSASNGAPARHRMVDGKLVYGHSLPEAWVYEFVPDPEGESIEDGKWVEQYYIPHETWPEDHVLWQRPAREARKPVSERAVASALASIAKASRVTRDE